MRNPRSLVWGQAGELNAGLSSGDLLRSNVAEKYRLTCENHEEFGQGIDPECWLECAPTAWAYTDEPRGCVDENDEPCIDQATDVPVQPVDGWKCVDPAVEHVTGCMVDTNSVSDTHNLCIAAPEDAGDPHFQGDAYLTGLTQGATASGDKCTDRADPICTTNVPTSDLDGCPPENLKCSYLGNPVLSTFDHPTTGATLLTVSDCVASSAGCAAPEGHEGDAAAQCVVVAGGTVECTKEHFCQSLRAVYSPTCPESDAGNSNNCVFKAHDPFSKCSTTKQVGSNPTLVECDRVRLVVETETGEWNDGTFEITKGDLVQPALGAAHKLCSNTESNNNPPIEEVACCHERKQWRRTEESNNNSGPYALELVDQPLAVFGTPTQGNGALELADLCPPRKYCMGFGGLEATPYRGMLEMSGIIVAGYLISTLIACSCTQHVKFANCFCPHDLGYMDAVHMASYANDGSKKVQMYVEIFACPGWGIRLWLWYQRRNQNHTHRGAERERQCQKDNLYKRGWLLAYNIWSAILFFSAVYWFVYVLIKDDFGYDKNAKEDTEDEKKDKKDKRKKARAAQAFWSIALYAYGALCASSVIEAWATFHTCNAEKFGIVAGLLSRWLWTTGLVAFAYISAASVQASCGTRVGGKTTCGKKDDDTDARKYIGKDGTIYTIFKFLIGFFAVVASFLLLFFYGLRYDGDSEDEQKTLIEVSTVFFACRSIILGLIAGKASYENCAADELEARKAAVVAELDATTWVKDAQDKFEGEIDDFKTAAKTATDEHTAGKIATYTHEQRLGALRAIKNLQKTGTDLDNANTTLKTDLDKRVDDIKDAAGTIRANQGKIDRAEGAASPDATTGAEDFKKFFSDAGVLSDTEIGTRKAALKTAITANTRTNATNFDSGAAKTSMDTLGTTETALRTKLSAHINAEKAKIDPLKTAVNAIHVPATTADDYWTQNNRKVQAEADRDAQMAKVADLEAEYGAI